MFDSLVTNTLWKEHLNLEEYTAYLSARGHKDIHILQTSEGAFYSKYRHVRLDKFSVAVRDTKSAYIANLFTDINSYTFNIYECLNGYYINGTRVDNHSVYIVEPYQELLVTSNKNTKHLSFKIEKIVLDEHLNTSDLMFDDAFAIQVIKTKNEELIKLFSNMLYSVIFNNEKLSLQVIRDIEEVGLYTLVKMLSKDNVRQVCPGSHYRIVRRAQEYIHSHYCATLSVLDICKRAHCSLRNLEYAFKKILGLTPKKYLVLLRMHNIRTEITIHCDVNRPALLDKYGVLNPSRFYNDYKALFGEDLRDDLK